MDIDPEKRAGLLEQATFAGNEQVNDLELRPITSATWSLLARLKNSFVTGEQSADYAFNVYSFVYLHSRTIADIRRRIATIDDLTADIFEFMDTRPPGDMFAFLPWITRQVEMVAASITASGNAVPTMDDSPKV